MAVVAAPQLMAEVERLVERHRAIDDEPLLLAVYFEPDRQPGDVFVFEVIDGFGDNRVANDRTLMEASYPSTPFFPLADGHRLHLVLTNPAELAVAGRDGWIGLDEVRRAMRDGRATTVYAAPGRPDLEALLHG